MLLAALESLRPHQWSKNLLLVVPPLLAHAWRIPDVVGAVAIAFVAFCLVASGNYVLNDLLDIEADRAHPSKRLRPLPSGRLPLLYARITGPGLILVGIGCSWLTMPREFTLFLIGYVLLSLAYSLALKRLLLIDVMVIATLYTLRLMAGGAASGVEVSSWLLIYSMFFFISLAFAKRLTELDATGDGGGATTAARAYRSRDREAFATAGPAAGMLSILVLTLYVSSELVRAQYQHPDILWLLCPLLLYWVLRLWFIALRGELHHDPVVFALRDRVSYGVAAGIVLVMYLAWR